MALDTTAQVLGACGPSRNKKIVQVLAAAIYCLFAAGIVFGYAALKPVLIAEGVYRDRCTQKELDDNVEVCGAQELRLNLMFTVAAAATNINALPVGALLDCYGPKVASLVGVLFLSVGSLLMAFAHHVRHTFDAYIPAYLCFALGGPFVFISSFQLSNTFPRYSGSILALLTGAFDTSSAVFLGYRLVYEHTNGGFHPRKFFLLYLVVPAYTLIVQIAIMPKKSYKSVSEQAVVADDSQSGREAGNGYHNTVDGSEQVVREGSSPTETTPLLTNEGIVEQTEKEERKKRLSGVYGALHGQTATKQVTSGWFILMALFTMLQMCRINYFVATIRPQYEYLLGSSTDAKQINGFFDVALPLGGVIAIPFIGGILDNFSTVTVLAIMVIISTLIGIFGLIASAWAAYIQIILFVFYRPFYYTVVSDYGSKVFGFNTFGKVYGLIIFLAGLFNFVQYGLDSTTQHDFDGNPTPINSVLLLVGFTLGVVLVAYVWIKGKRMRIKGLEERVDSMRA